MGRIRTFIELGLAGGAVLGLLGLTLPQFLGGEANAGPAGTASVVSREAIAAAPEQTLDIAHFLGIAQFVKSPTKYSFICGLTGNPDDEAAQAEVVSASLEGDLLEIEYRYPTAGTLKTGKLVGKLNSDGVFDGTYQGNNNQEIASNGDITFTFEADGTAKGSYDKGQGAIRIFL